MSDNNKIFSNPENFQKALQEAQKADANVQSSNEQEVESDNTLQIDQQETQKADSLNAQELNEQDEAASEDIASEDIASENIEVDEPSNDNEAQPKSHLIPKSRFNKEIEKRKTLEKSLQEEREARIRMEERMEALRRLEDQMKPQETQSKEPELNPLDGDAHNYYLKQINELKQELQGIKGETQSTKQMNYMAQVVESQERAFAAEHPDFQDALSHVQQVEMEVAKDFFDTPEEAQNYVAQKLQGAIMTSAQKGKNAAEMMYNMAKKYGYQNKKTATNTPKRNIDAINRNMNKSASIRGAGNAANLANKGMANIESAFRRPGDATSGIDPEKFHQLLKKAQENRY